MKRDSLSHCRRYPSCVRPVIRRSGDDNVNYEDRPVAEGGGGRELNEWGSTNAWSAATRYKSAATRSQPQTDAKT